MTVFTDIDCPYCAKLHSQIKQYEDEGIRVRYMLFPVPGPVAVLRRGGLGVVLRMTATRL